jgi:nitrogen PTS system EIIA component
MVIGDLIAPDRIVVGLRIGDKGRLLQELARRAASLIGIDAKTVLTALELREQLGSTGLGKGLALPHARVQGLKGFFGLFVRLARPIDFDAIDGVPVDLVFVLLIPTGAESEQVAALATIAKLLRNAELLQRLRYSKDAATVYNLFASP